jgi:hypothetical protein
MGRVDCAIARTCLLWFINFVLLLAVRIYLILAGIFVAIPSKTLEKLFSFLKDDNSLLFVGISITAVVAIERFLEIAKNEKCYLSVFKNLSYEKNCFQNSAGVYSKADADNWPRFVERVEKLIKLDVPQVQVDEEKPPPSNGDPNKNMNKKLSEEPSSKSTNDKSED